MSIGEEFEKFRKRVGEEVKKMSKLLENYSEKIEEIRKEIEIEENRGKLWDKLIEVKEIRNKVKEESLKVREELKKELMEVKKKFLEPLAGKEEWEEAREKFEELREFLEDELDYLEGEVEPFVDKARDLEDTIRTKIRMMRKKEVGISVIKLPEVKILDIGKIIEDALSKPWIRGPSAIVSSVRLPESDLKLIDALVDAGIFRSRNEGIAFFAHKGIEASKDWLSKVKEKIDEIRKLQEETKKEIERITKGSEEENKREPSNE